MAPSGVWPLIHGEREALAADLADLTDEQWATASLCPGWSVRDVLGHLTATAKMTPGAFFVHLAQARFRFHDMSDQLIAAEATAVPADGLTEFRKHLGDTTHPPGPVPAMLGEAVVHGEDIRRPLGIKRDYPPEAVTRAANFLKGSNLLMAASAGSPGSACGPTTSSGRPGAAPR
ncbi:MAG TPA: maleylpyruvate isomerase family mycothiol-dependent enzyme [Streptosporangiaceae bacterium]|jgi:uncharacterized protein (TIGR03083 family)|nr:maleylpyruvate isomerase family mycothiol-dependent enzyme [Streptosporangiaceae bacterium]